MRGFLRRAWHHQSVLRRVPARALLFLPLVVLAFGRCYVMLCYVVVRRFAQVSILFFGLRLGLPPAMPSVSKSRPPAHYPNQALGAQVGRPGSGRPRLAQSLLVATLYAPFLQVFAEKHADVSDGLMIFDDAASDAASKITDDGTRPGCFRIPAAAQTGNGTLIALAEARLSSGCGDNTAREIMYRRSVDGGQSFGGVAIAVGNSTYAVGNPTVVAKDNVVILFYIEHAGEANTLYVYSKDHGATWSAPVGIPLLTKQTSSSEKSAMPGPGTGLITSKGRVMFIAHHGPYVVDSVYYSDTLLAKLQKGDEVSEKTVDWTEAKSDFKGMDEAAVAELSDGRIMANMRHREEPVKGRGVAVSLPEKDGEPLTFSDLTYRQGLYGPVCQGSLVTGYSPEVMYFANPRSHAGRKDTTVQVSYDDGATFPKQILIEPRGSAGYSCLVPGNLIVGAQAGKNVGGILYESPNSATSSAVFEGKAGAAIAWKSFEVPPKPSVVPSVVTQPIFA